MAYGEQGLGAVKRALPACEYSQIKLVAAMMNTQQHWFAPETEASAGAAAAGPSGGGQRQLAAAAENVALNSGTAAPAVAGYEPEAKRQRLSSSMSGYGVTAATPAAAAADVIDLVGGLTPEDLNDLDDWS